MAAVKESGFFPRLWYHSASSPVTYQTQCNRLLSDVNVFGRLFLCWSTLRMVVVEKPIVKLFFLILASSRLMYRTSPVIILNKPIQGEASPIRPVRAYFPIMTSVLYIIPYLNYIKLH